MSMDTMRQALKALTLAYRGTAPVQVLTDAIKALEKALEQEPEVASLKARVKVLERENAWLESHGK